jgi:hypothetical protein
MNLAFSSREKKLFFDREAERDKEYPFMINCRPMILRSWMMQRRDKKDEERQ